MREVTVDASSDDTALRLLVARLHTLVSGMYLMLRSLFLIERIPAINMPYVIHYLSEARMIDLS